MIEPSNAGPFEIGLDSDLPADGRRSLYISEIKGGPTDKKGWFRKFFGKREGMDYAYVVNTSNELLKYESTGGVSGVVPPASSVYVGVEASDRSSVKESAHPIRRITVINNSNNPVPSDSVSVQIGNVNRGEDKPKFSPQNVVRDLIPGVR